MSIAHVRAEVVAQAEQLEARGLSGMTVLAALDSLSVQAGEQSDRDASSSASRGRGLTAADTPGYVAIVAIERFTTLREEFGEPAANALLDEMAAKLLAGVDGASLGRINRSSIEFAFQAADFAAAEAALHKLHDRLEGLTTLDGQQIHLEVTIGFAGRGAGADGVDAVVERAELALANARTAHAKVAAFTEANRVERLERIAMLRDLRRAIPQNQLSVSYQPKLHLRRGEVSSVEALVRWVHPTRGPVPTDRFIALAEQTDEIRAITEFVIRKALVDADVLEAGGTPVNIAVNISGHLLADVSFTDWAIQETRNAGGRIGFEITETAIIGNPQLALDHLQQFHVAGIRLAIDDYGSGLSSLSYLKQIPAQELKIDRMFISGLTSSNRDPLLVRSTIDLAHALEMEVTAEGVDNPLTLALLKVMKCDIVQGYHFSKPLPLDELVVFLRAHQDQIAVSPPPVVSGRQSKQG